MNQSTNTVFLIRPANFGFNSQTAVSNAFQTNTEFDHLQQKVLNEFDHFAKTLEQKGINVIVFEDTAKPIKPDAIFPNNWISTHEDGTIVLYPMCATNRRTERRMDIVEKLKEDFSVSKIVDFSSYEAQNRFVEGTGSILFDRINKDAYACLSPRTDQKLFETICSNLGYNAFSFDAKDQNGQEIYHTNVMMCLGKDFVLVCLDAIQGEQKQKEFALKMALTGHEIIEISLSQMMKFAGNMLTVKQENGKDALVMSQTAYDALTFRQRDILHVYADLLPIPIPTIETIGGGSARCMIAEVFLK